MEGAQQIQNISLAELIEAYKQEVEKAKERIASESYTKAKEVLRYLEKYTREYIAEIEGYTSKAKMAVERLNNALILIKKVKEEISKRKDESNKNIIEKVIKDLEILENWITSIKDKKIPQSLEKVRELYKNIAGKELNVEIRVFEDPQVKEIIKRVEESKTIKEIFENVREALRRTDKFLINSTERKYLKSLFDTGRWVEYVTKDLYRDINKIQEQTLKERLSELVKEYRFRTNKRAEEIFWVADSLERMTQMLLDVFEVKYTRYF
jgi:hypothetical protein